MSGGARVSGDASLLQVRAHISSRVQIESAQFIQFSSDQMRMNRSELDQIVSTT